MEQEILEFVKATVPTEESLRIYISERFGVSSVEASRIIQALLNARIVRFETIEMN